MPTLARVDNYGREQARSISGFVQGTYPLTDKLSLTAGSRYTRDKVTYTGTTKIAGTTINLDPEQTKTLVSKKPTWRLSLDNQFSPDILGYLSYNRGVKSGGFAMGPSPSNYFGYQSEQLNAYEGGMKTELRSEESRVGKE